MNDDIDIDIDFNSFTMQLILHSAVNDYLGYDFEREEYQLAREWLFEDFEETLEDRIANAGNGFVSLSSICDILELDMDRLRIFVKMMEDMKKTRIVESQFKNLLNSCRQRK